MYGKNLLCEFVQFVYSFTECFHVSVFVRNVWWKHQFLELLLHSESYFGFDRNFVKTWIEFSHLTHLPRTARAHTKRMPQFGTWYISTSHWWHFSKLWKMPSQISDGCSTVVGLGWIDGMDISGWAGVRYRLKITFCGANENFSSTGGLNNMQHVWSQMNLLNSFTFPPTSSS